MKRINETEPPSCPHPSLFMIGQDGHGNWVVQDQSGIRGGLFVDRTEALRFVRAENGNCAQACVVVGGVFELDMTRASRPSSCDASLNRQSARRVA